MEGADVVDGAGQRPFSPGLQGGTTAGQEDLDPQPVVLLLGGAHALVVATEWPEFRQLSPDDVAGEMIGRLVLDPGRFLGPDFARDPRFSLICVGRVS